MSVFKLKDVLISLILSFLLLLGVVFPISSTTAQDYDIVIETEINEQTVKIIEINFSEDIVHFYKFDGDGNPIYESGEQVTFVPGDEDFEEYVANLSGALIVNALTIQSNEEFSFQIYYGNLSNWKMVLQLCYDGASTTDYRLYEHHELDEPFDAGSIIGDFSILFVDDETYTGYKYSVNPLEANWNRVNTQGGIFGNNFAEAKKLGSSGRPRFKITGKTSSGKNVKVEDKGDGHGPRVYEGEDENGNGKIDDDEWEEVTDSDEIEDIMDEITNDLENGLGDYEGEAWDTNGTPIDFIFFFKKSNGDYLCVGITQNGELSGTTLTHDEMVQKGILASGEDSNPRGAWFVGIRIGDTSRWSFEKYARFSLLMEEDKNGDGDTNDPGEREWIVDPEGEQYPYEIGQSACGEPITIVDQGTLNPGGGRYSYIVDLGEWWP